MQIDVTYEVFKEITKGTIYYIDADLEFHLYFFLTEACVVRCVVGKETVQGNHFKEFYKKSCIMIMSVRD